MQEFYIVRGYTGQFDDFKEWIVAVYYNEEQAKYHVKLANRASSKIFNSTTRHQKPTLKTVYDPYFDMYDDGAYYDMVTVPIGWVKLTDKYKEPK